MHYISNNPFPLQVSEEFIARITPGNINDPLLRQILPTDDELLQVEGFTKDPTGDSQATVVPGLLHKYANRVLLTVTGACPIHCRYCFRRHYPYGDANPLKDNLDAVVTYLRTHTEIDEVILSGGDPLMLPLQQLQQITAAITALPHIQRLRIHSRVPVALPSRLNSEWFQWLRDISVPLVIVIHTNHPAEIDSHVRNLLTQLAPIATLLNQSALLRNVNDNTDVLVALSKKLFQSRVLPYYLNQLDKVAGASHFYIDNQTALKLHHSLRLQLPGYLVPRLVQDVAKSSSKTEIS